MQHRRVSAFALSCVLVLIASAAVSANSVRSTISLPVDPSSPLSLIHLNQQRDKTRLGKATKTPPSQPATPNTQTGEVVGNRITLLDGYSFDVDDVWKDGTELWYRQGKVSRGLPQVSIKSIKPILRSPEPRSDTTAQVTKVAGPPSPPVEKKPVNWVHLVDGARFRVDEVQETPEGFWYSRANLSIFLERDRVARIEIDRGDTAAPSWRGSDWTSGNNTIDQLIRSNGSRFGVDPYLVFLVIEQESHFRSRAVSPKGARGLMQLMPSTARRFGVKNSFDVAENIKGGTQYLRELMDMFNGQVNLVLASYNAGEGAVLKYGRNVPPYRETRDYVKKIGKRYGLAGREASENETPAPRR